MLSVSFAIISGIALAFWGNSLVDLFWVSYLPVALWLAWISPRYQFYSVLVGAFLWASLLLAQQLEQGLDPDFDNQVVVLTGVITNISETRKNSVRFQIKPDHIQTYTRALPEKIRLSWYREQTIPQAGERWQLQVKLRMPGGFKNPGAFDYERWLFIKNIAATGYVKRSTVNRKLTDGSWFNIDRYRLKLVKSIDQACVECRFSGLFKALAVGFRGDIPIDQDRLLRDTGTAHLLAISGLHIGLVAGLFYLIGGQIWRLWVYRTGVNRLECSAVLAIVAATSYAALAGFSIPTVRALVMLMVVLLALISRRSVNLLNSIALAVSIILLCDPLAIGSASFWLSISALMVIALGQFLSGPQQSWLRSLLRIQLLFSLLFIPLSILLFQQASPAGFVANIVAIPLLTFIILPVTLIGSLLAVLDISFATTLFYWLDQVTGWLLGYLQTLLELGLNTYEDANRPILLLACMAIGFVLLLMPISWRARLPAVVLILVALLWQPEEIDSGQFQMTVLDVGMGTSVVVETEYHSLIYDLGPGNRDGFSAGDWVVKPYLQHRGLGRADLMVISHVDADHSGGFVSFVDDYDAFRLVSGTPGELAKRFDLDHAVRSCHDYAPWRWDGIDFEFLSTGTHDAPQSSNNNSCVLKISGNQSVLLSGDIEAEQETRLATTQAGKLDTNVLLAPHHGSLTSSTAAFVKLTSAEVTIFTVGRNNRWGFPKAQVVDQYQNLGSRIYRTDLHGAITVLSGYQGLQIKSRRQARRIWHR